MEFFPPASSLIQSLDYDAASERLQVVFLNGRTYHYASVPEDHFRALVMSPSVGTFFAKHTRPRYTGVEQKELPDA